MADPIPYSFADVNCSIVGPGGAFSISDDGTAKEGITIEFIDDDSEMMLGTNSSGMHSGRTTRGGRVTIRLLKNNPSNRRLMVMRNTQKAGGQAGGSLNGRNVLSLSNPFWGDEHHCRAGAFGKPPTLTYAEDGGTMEWVMNFIYIDPILGDGSLVL